MSRITVITPRLSLARYFSDLKAYGELLYFLAQRDLAVRYKQTVAGVLWAILVPLLTVLALAFVFGHVAKLEGSSILSIYAGMIPWQFFSSGLSTGGTSLLGNTNLVTKLYFPRVILPLSSLGVCLVDLLLNFILMIVIALFLGATISERLIFIPIWILVVFFATLGPILIVSAALVRYRDLRFLLPFIIQFGLFVTPVGYTLASVPEALRAVFGLNPLVGVIEAMRWSLLNTGEFPAVSLWLSMGVSTVLLIIGAAMFLKAESTMADEL